MGALRWLLLLAIPSVTWADPAPPVLMLPLEPQSELGASAAVAETTIGSALRLGLHGRGVFRIGRRFIAEVVGGLTLMPTADQEVDGDSGKPDGLQLVGSGTFVEVSAGLRAHAIDRAGWRLAFAVGFAVRDETPMTFTTTESGPTGDFVRAQQHALERSYTNVMDPGDPLAMTGDTALASSVAARWDRGPIFVQAEVGLQVRGIFDRLSSAIIGSESSSFVTSYVARTSAGTMISARWSFAVDLNLMLEAPSGSSSLAIGFTHACRGRRWSFRGWRPFELRDTIVFGIDLTQ